MRIPIQRRDRQVHLRHVLSNDRREASRLDEVGQVVLVRRRDRVRGLDERDAPTPPPGGVLSGDMGDTGDIGEVGAVCLTGETAGDKGVPKEALLLKAADSTAVGAAVVVIVFVAVWTV